MSGLESYINHTVSIMTVDGRNFIGTLKGFEQTNNIIDEYHEQKAKGEQLFCNR